MVRHRRPLGSANLKWLRLQLVPSATVLGLLLSAVLAVSANAQQTPTPAQPPPSVMTDQELAISVHNPFEDFVKVPIQSTTGFQLGRNHNAGESLNIEPLVPFSLNADWDLFARPSLTFTYAPSPHEQFGLEDLETSFFLTPAKNSTWIWGLGRSLTFPLPAARNWEPAAGRPDQPRRSSTQRARGSTTYSHTNSCRLPEIVTAEA